MSEGKRSAASASTTPAASRTLEFSARAGASVAVLLGLVVLTGWWLDVPILKSGMPGYVTMKPNTAAGLLLAGTSLWLLAPESRARRRTVIGLGCAAACALIGALTLLAYLGGPSRLNIDELIFVVTENTGRTTTPGRMAATTAVGFVGLGLALVCLDARGRWSRMLGALALTGTVAIPLAVLVGYLYRVIPVAGSGQGLQMAVHTAVGFLALTGGIIASRPRVGVARMLQSQGPGGVLSRRLVPIALGMPVSLGLLRLAAESTGTMNAESAAASATVATMMLLAWVAWRTAVNLDATNDARLAAEVTITERNAELESTNQRLVAAQKLAQAASAAKSDFLSRMSHELRTPLNSIIGFVGVLLRNREGRFAAKDLEYLGRVQRNGQHLLTLINDILDLARVESGKLTVTLELVALDRLIDDILLEMQGSETRADVRIHADVPQGLAPLRTDALKLKQMIINLVANALKFTAEGRVTVRVATWPDGRRAMRLDVIDTGIGIAADRLDAIFGAFEQAELHTSRRFGGTGLGLSISRAFAEALGYAIAVRSTVGVGSVFSILLDPDAEPPRAPHTSDGDLLGAARILGGATNSA